MKPLLALALSPFLASATPLAHGPIYAGMPPEQYWMTDAVVITLYVNDVARHCGTVAPPGMTVLGCTRHVDGVTVMVLPNPCLLADELYARIACHERAHAAGWTRMHEL